MIPLVMWACWVTHNLHCPGWRGELNRLRSARKKAKDLSGQ